MAGRCDSLIQERSRGSSMTGSGEPLSDDAVRAVMVIRLNQLAAAGSGVHPRLLRALEQALRVGALPLVHTRGAIGTGDLTALAEIGLTLAGELP